MSIELKQAAQQVLDAFEAFGEADDFATLFTLTQKMNVLRTAIPQEESEPVGFVDFQGTVLWHDGPPPADSLLFAAKPVSHDKAKWCEYVAGMVFAWLEMQENLKEEDRCIKAITGIIERRMWALPTTHPAPGVPDADFDLVCNAIDKADTISMEGDYMLDSDDCIAVVRVMQALLSVRAAMLPAAQAQKGQP